jgi:zinc protease
MRGTSRKKAGRASAPERRAPPAVFSIWLRPLQRTRASRSDSRCASAAPRERGPLAGGAPIAVRTFADAYFALYLQTGSRRLGFAMDDAFYGIDQPYLERLRARGPRSPSTSSTPRSDVMSPDRLSRPRSVASDAEELADAIASERESPITYPTTVPESVVAEDREIVGYRLGIPQGRIQLVPVDRMFAE